MGYPGEFVPVPDGVDAGDPTVLDGEPDGGVEFADELDMERRRTNEMG
ncbi:MAG: hypothetical protein WD274_03350 [Acidimicrobiia bacterium]